MSVIVDPYEDPGPWGQFIVGGSPMPGILTGLGMPDRAYEYAIQNGYGSTKVVIYRATGIIDGIEVVHFIRPRTDTDPGDWTRWESWMKTMVKGWPAKFTGKPPAFPAVHPAAQAVGLSRICLKTYGAPFQAIQDDPARFYKVTYVEYAPDQKIKTGEVEPAEINGPPVPQNAFEAMIDNARIAFGGEQARIAPAVATGSAR